MPLTVLGAGLWGGVSSWGPPLQSQIEFCVFHKISNFHKIALQLSELHFLNCIFKLRNSVYTAQKIMKIQSD